MDRMEILKMALAHTPDPKAAMELARDMEAFLRRENPVPKWVTETVKNLGELQSETPGKLPEKPRKNRQPWSQNDLVNLHDLIKKNYLIKDMQRILGRSTGSIKTAIGRLRSGEYALDWPPSEKPRTPTQQVNAGTFPGYKS